MEEELDENYFKEKMEARVEWSEQMLVVTKLCWDRCMRKNVSKFGLKQRKCFERCGKEFRMITQYTTNQVHYFLLKR